MKFLLIFLLSAAHQSLAEKPTFELIKATSSEPIHLHLFAGKEESLALKVKGISADQITGRLFQKAGSTLAPVQKNQVLKIGENRTLELIVTLPDLKQPAEFLFVFHPPSLPAIRISGFPATWIPSFAKNKRIGLISPPSSLAKIFQDLNFSTMVIEREEKFDGEILICFGSPQSLRNNIRRGRTIVVRSPKTDFPETWISKNEQDWLVYVPHHTFDSNQLQSARGHATLARLFFQNPN